LVSDQIVAIPALAQSGDASKRMNELCPSLALCESAESHPNGVLAGKPRSTDTRPDVCQLETLRTFSAVPNRMQVQSLQDRLRERPRAAL